MVRLVDGGGDRISKDLDALGDHSSIELVEDASFD
jgi:hypothetical protein